MLDDAALSNLSFSSSSSSASMASHAPRPWRYTPSRNRDRSTKLSWLDEALVLTLCGSRYVATLGDGLGNRRRKPRRNSVWFSGRLPRLHQPGAY